MPLVGGPHLEIALTLLESNKSAHYEIVTGIQWVCSCVLVKGKDVFLTQAVKLKLDNVGVYR